MKFTEPPVGEPITPPSAELEKTPPRKKTPPQLIDPDWQQDITESEGLRQYAREHSAARRYQGQAIMAN